MSWHKRDDSFWTNPKVAEAGEIGALVFDVLLCINSRRKRGGRLAAGDLEPSGIQVQLGIIRRSTKQIAAGIEACKRAGLIAPQYDGGAQIVGYDDEWCPRTGPATVTSTGEKSPEAIRQQRYRDLRRNGERNAETVTRNVTRNGESNATTVTPSVTGRVTPRVRASGSGSGELEEEKEIGSLSVHPRSTQPQRPAGAERASLSSPSRSPEPSNGGASDGAEPEKVCSRIEDLPQDIQEMLAALKPRSPQQTESKRASTDATDRALAGGVYGEEGT